MPEQQEKPYRLAGICKTCHEFRYGFLPFGRAPFTCYQCAEKRTNPTAPTVNLPISPDSTTMVPMYFSFTVSNDATSNWKEGQA